MPQDSFEVPGVPGVLVTVTDNGGLFVDGVPFGKMKDPYEVQGKPGVTLDLITGISVDRREIPEEYKKNLRHLLAKFRRERLARLRLGEEVECFTASCDAVNDRSDGATHNID